MAEKTKKVEEVAENVEATPAREEMVTFLVPRKGKEHQMIVGLNFKNYILVRGEYVTVPKGVMEVIKNSERAEEFADAFANAKEEAFLEKAAKQL